MTFYGLSTNSYVTGVPSHPSSAKSNQVTILSAYFENVSLSESYCSVTWYYSGAHLHNCPYNKFLHPWHDQIGWVKIQRHFQATAALHWLKRYHGERPPRGNNHISHLGIMSLAKGKQGCTEFGLMQTLALARKVSFWSAAYMIAKLKMTWGFFVLFFCMPQACQNTGELFPILERINKWKIVWCKWTWQYILMNSLHAVCILEMSDVDSVENWRPT